VKACTDQTKYPNGVVALHEDFGTVGIIKMLGISGFSVDDESIYYAEDFFLDILEDEKEEPKQYGRSPFNQTVVNAPKPDIEKAEKIIREALAKPLSFSEPLTKEAVGRVIVGPKGNRLVIVDISLCGKIFYGAPLYDETNCVTYVHRWMADKGYRFESEPISIEEAEKLTGKRIKR
jgi:hypothetical protein